jgi:hypothetical protein
MPRGYTLNDHAHIHAQDFFLADSYSKSSGYNYKLQLVVSLILRGVHNEGLFLRSTP